MKDEWSSEVTFKHSIGVGYGVRESGWNDILEGKYNNFNDIFNKVITNILKRRLEQCCKHDLVTAAGLVL